MGSVGDFFLGGGNAPTEGQPGFIRGFLGGVAADEPRAALVARQVLAQGGDAADAATALGFALTVTLPSRAGLGAGGACLAYNPSRDGPGGGVPEAILFTPVAAPVTAGSDRPAAVPMLARGLYALQARYGRRPIETLIVPAEQLAHFGVQVSRAFANDLAVVSGPLLADPGARAIFGPSGTPLAEGATLLQPDLGSTLSQLRVGGVGDLYQGVLARRLVEGSAIVGGALSADALRGALPRTAAPIILRSGRDRVAFLPPPADGGLAAAAAFQVLQGDARALAQAQERAMGVALRWRAGGGDPMAVLAAAGSAGALPPLPASTSFATLDRDGNAVACAVTMDNLFGTGRVVPETGMLLAASPAAVPPPLLSAALAWNDNIHAFRAEVAASGQAGAPLAVAAGLIDVLRGGGNQAVPVPEPGRVNAIACSGYLPDAQRSCRWATDPRGAGLALGGD
ncbi:MAG: gamma-glutamyltransferase [Acidisphaera sp.]|nr:gamma-glutamyltransferase [Acidisphaera sp.]